MTTDPTNRVFSATNGDKPDDQLGSATGRATDERFAREAGAPPSPGSGGSPSSRALDVSVTGMVPEATSGRVTRSPAGAEGHNVPPSITRHVNTVTDADHREAEARALVCARFEELTRDPRAGGSGLSLNQAARALGRSVSFFSGDHSPYARWRREGLAGLMPARRANTGAKPGDLSTEIEALPWFIPAARYFYLNSNRDRIRGSVPQSLRRVISLPHVPRGWTKGHLRKFLDHLGLAELPVCPEALRETILARQRAGQDMVPERITRAITAGVGQANVTFHRNPRDFGLNYLSSPGSMRLFWKDGQRVRIRGGDWTEADDSTPGVGVCVPWDRCGTPCADKFHVMLGRFQWLPFMDAAWDYVQSFTYVIRPRSSYRKEDVGSGMRGAIRAHGVPREGFRFERGTWESKFVKNIVAGLGVKLWTVHSPHNKIIEILFNRVWTKLAIQFPHADLGRYRGENEANCKVYDACKAGHRDPRKYFPMLQDVIAVFLDVIAEHNRTRIDSRNYGAWVPEEAWHRDITERPLRPLNPESDWLFAPHVGEWTVRGNLVGGKVPLFEEFSVPFDFSAPWLPDFHGAKVRCHFDPMEPKCNGVLVLREPFAGRPAGTILCDARGNQLVTSVNETAGYARLVLGWGDDPATVGKLERQKAASYVRRETRAVVPGGRVVHSSTEIRDGITQAAAVEQTSAPKTRPTPESRDSAPVQRARAAPQISEEELRAREAAAGETTCLDYL